MFFLAQFHHVAEVKVLHECRTFLQRRRVKGKGAKITIAPSDEQGRNVFAFLWEAYYFVIRFRRESNPIYDYKT
jgi:hypothetical protein